MCTECCNQAEAVSQGVGLCVAFGFMASSQGAALQSHALEHLRIVDTYADEGVWVTLDEGCNSCCRGKAWALNAEDKYDKIG